MQLKKKQFFSKKKSQKNKKRKTFFCKYVHNKIEPPLLSINACLLVMPEVNGSNLTPGFFIQIISTCIVMTWNNVPNHYYIKNCGKSIIFNVQWWMCGTLMENGTCQNHLWEVLQDQPVCWETQIFFLKKKRSIIICPQNMVGLSHPMPFKLLFKWKTSSIEITNGTCHIMNSLVQERVIQIEDFTMTRDPMILSTPIPMLNPTQNENGHYVQGIENQQPNFKT